MQVDWYEHRRARAPRSVICIRARRWIFVDLAYVSACRSDKVGASKCFHLTKGVSFHCGCVSLSVVVYGLAGCIEAFDPDRPVHMPVE